MDPYLKVVWCYDTGIMQVEACREAHEDDNRSDQKVHPCHNDWEWALGAQCMTCCEQALQAHIYSNKICMPPEWAA
jgi:hypothetical protein